VLRDSRGFLPEQRPLVVEVDTVVEGRAQPVEEGLVLGQAEGSFLAAVDICEETEAALGPEDCLELGIDVEV